VAAITLKSPIARSGSAVVAEVDGQLVALDANQGICYGLNRVATRIWSLMDSPTTGAAVIEALLREFEIDRDTCEVETLNLLNDLQAAGLISVAATADAA
jgi:hypothetical protein